MYEHGVLNLVQYLVAPRSLGTAAERSDRVFGPPMNLDQHIQICVHFLLCPHLMHPPRGVQWYHPQTLLAALIDHCWAVWTSPAM
eukprot:SAG22_NODE_290_length_12941_cov_3.715465_6_plen_84_part_01